MEKHARTPIVWITSVTEQPAMVELAQFVETTQQTRARKEFKALGRADKNGISDVELAVEMAAGMDDPESAATLLQAAASIVYMRGVKSGLTPITDATNRCLEKRRRASSMQVRLA